MPFGQSAFATNFTLVTTRRVTFLVSRGCGRSHEEAAKAADEVSIAAASVIAAAAAIVTADPVGFAASVALLGLEAKDAESFASRMEK